MEQFDKYQLSEKNVLFDKGSLYTSIFPEETKDFAFQIHETKFKNLWILVEGDSIRLENSQAVFNYKVIPVKLQSLPPIEELQSKEFSILLQVIVNDILTKVWEWEQNPTSHATEEFVSKGSYNAYNKQLRSQKNTEATKIYQMMLDEAKIKEKVGDPNII